MDTFVLHIIILCLKCKSLLDYANVFPPNEYEKNNKIILKYFKMKKLYCVVCSKNRKFNNSKISYVFEKTLVLSITCSKGKNEDEKIFKEEESIEAL